MFSRIFVAAALLTVFDNGCVQEPAWNQASLLADSPTSQAAAAKLFRVLLQIEFKNSRAVQTHTALETRRATVAMTCGYKGRLLLVVSISEPFPYGHLDAF